MDDSQRVIVSGERASPNIVFNDNSTFDNFAFSTAIMDPKKNEDEEHEKDEDEIDENAEQQLYNSTWLEWGAGLAGAGVAVAALAATGRGAMNEFRENGSQNLAEGNLYKRSGEAAFSAMKKVGVGGYSAAALGAVT